MSAYGFRNLRVALQRHHLMGPARFTRHLSVRTRSARKASAAAMGRVARGFSKRPVCAQPPRRLACTPQQCDVRPKAWPYDTALPAGLPQLPEGPGRPDNVALLLRRPLFPTPRPPVADQVGIGLDVTG